MKINSTVCNLCRGRDFARRMNEHTFFVTIQNCILHLIMISQLITTMCAWTLWCQLKVQYYLIYIYLSYFNITSSSIYFPLRPRANCISVYFCISVNWPRANNSVWNENDWTEEILESMFISCIYKGTSIRVRVILLRRFNYNLWLTTLWSPSFFILCW